MFDDGVLCTPWVVNLSAHALQSELPQGFLFYPDGDCSNTRVIHTRNGWITETQESTSEIYERPALFYLPRVFFYT